jgi:hypothetical protein
MPKPDTDFSGSIIIKQMSTSYKAFWIGRTAAKFLFSTSLDALRDRQAYSSLVSDSALTQPPITPRRCESEMQIASICSFSRFARAQHGRRRAALSL